MDTASTFSMRDPESTSLRLFADVAAALVEAVNAEQDVKLLRSTIAAVVAAAYSLPVPRADSTTLAVDVSEHTASVRALESRCREFLPEPINYVVVASPHDRTQLNEPTLLVGDVAEDLASVVGDIQIGLRAWRDGNMEEAGAWWRWAFDKHWESHALAFLTHASR